jgi:hypothetical protein
MLWWMAVVPAMPELEDGDVNPLRWLLPTINRLKGRHDLDLVTLTNSIS